MSASIFKSTGRIWQKVLWLGFTLRVSYGITFWSLSLYHNPSFIGQVPQKQIIIQAISRHASLDYGATRTGKSVMPGTRLLTGWQNNRGLILCRGENGIYSPKHPDLHWGQHNLLLNAVSPEVKRLEREANHSPHLMRKLRMSEAISLFPCVPSWQEQGNLYLYLAWNDMTASQWKPLKCGKE